jgi:hypothetical protein
VSSLALDLNQTALTPEAVAAWKTNLQQLAQGGPAAVGAIREFLERNQDLVFDPAKGGANLGYPSLRMALLTALQSIDGPEAIDLSLQTLQTTTQPREIALLAQSLERQAPEQHRQAILNATRESLNMVNTGQLAGTDVGPLFGVLQQYGGAEAVPELQTLSSKYKYYSAIALAAMPDGAGVPTLIGMLREPNGPPKGSHTAALEALAQVAPNHPQAQASLVEQAKLNQVPDALWGNVASAIAGQQMFIGNVIGDGYTPSSGDKTYHLSFGNQHFYSTAHGVKMTEEEVTRRMALLDELARETAANTAAQTAIQQARTTLQARRPAGQ